MTDVHPLGLVMRRFAVDWLDRADPAVPPEIMAPGYTIDIAGVEMVGRDAYVEATSAQLARFPGLTITVHDAIYAPDGADDTGRAALRFTEHGASARGGAAAWRGIGLFRVEDGRLVRNSCEEDYLGRRRQLLAGVADPVDPPMVAPWTEPVVPGDPEAERTVRAWLEGGGPRGDEGGLVHDDARPGSAAARLLDVETCEVRALFAAGRRVAFHAVQHGRYLGGLPDTDASPGSPASLAVAGLVDVDDDVTGDVVRDRLGLRKALISGKASGT